MTEILSQHFTVGRPKQFQGVSLSEDMQHNWAWSLLTFLCILRIRRRHHLLANHDLAAFLSHELQQKQW